MIHGKVRFGYVWITAYNPTVQNFLLTYCLGKNKLWNVFFGLRKTDKNNWMYFWISKKDLHILIKLISEICPNFM